MQVHCLCYLIDVLLTRYIIVRIHACIASVFSHDLHSSVVFLYQTVWLSLGRTNPFLKQMKTGIKRSVFTSESCLHVCTCSKSLESRWVKQSRLKASMCSFLASLMFVPSRASIWILPNDLRDLHAPPMSIASWFFRVEMPASNVAQAVLVVEHIVFCSFVICKSIACVILLIDILFTR